jgi:class 3 adenylate cyclase
MTKIAEDLATEEKLVVFFDICSSTSLLEDLLSTDNLRVFRNILIATKKFLQESAAENGIDIYKFIGDGWVLLFPSQISGAKLVRTLTDLSCFFHYQLEKKVVPILQNTPKVLGLTFGVDLGRVVRIVMLGKREYIGRPLNVASRLQGAVKDRDKKPAYKALFTKHAFRALDLDSHSASLETRKLRNIFGGDRYECLKLTFGIPAKCKGSSKQRGRKP